jgi:hypothetical protein
MDPLDRLSAEYREVAERFRAGDHDAQLRLREIRGAIRERVAAEYEAAHEPKPRDIAPAERRQRARAERRRYAEQRAERLTKEWERWRYQRSKLPPDQRGPMLRPGQRACRYCRAAFTPATLRQRYCSPTHRKLHHKRKES